MRYFKNFRVGFSNHLEALESKDGNSHIAKELKKEIKQLKSKEDEIVIKMKQLIESDDILYNKFENIKTVKGFGDKTGIALIHFFITYPDANRQQLTALSGLDAIEVSSGSSIQRLARISKRGNAIYRSMLFMPVLSAIRSNPYMKAFYDRLKENGKHSTSAQIAVMRKMILIAHSLFKNNVPFDNEVYEKSIGWNDEKES